ncbi:hypothetical protein OU426_12570 [Frigidibacter sp. RF13]|uniref:hypothetical protein n=1 Tax=Frigidibacter sp. RF13 TaxID=2997340 RepID=UPI00226EAC0F|nr:hypothetical protein [Frigidibacter sp. RF13]MCY1127690.1 hypothetical protein [Frigidibacter sp. RF13]
MARQIRCRAAQWHARTVSDQTTSYADLIAEPPARTDLDPQAWSEDLGFIEGEIPLHHADAFHSLPEDEWYEATHRLRRRLPALSDADVPVALRQLLALVGDGHTSLQLPADVDRLPIGLFRFEDGLRIIRTTAGQEDLLGARILAIGRVAADEAERRVDALVPPENRWAPLVATPHFIVRRDVLDYFDLIEPEGEALLDLELPDGTLRSVSVAFGPRPQTGAWRHAGGAPPLWQQAPDESLFWRPLDDGTLYVNFRGYDGLGKKIVELMAEIDRAQPVRVVFDMRDNGGGDFKLFRRIVLPEITGRD